MHFYFSTKVMLAMLTSHSLIELNKYRFYTLKINSHKVMEHALISPNKRANIKVLKK